MTDPLMMPRLKKAMKEAIARNRAGAAALLRGTETLDPWSNGSVLGLLEAASLDGVTVQIVRTTETVLTLKRGKEEVSWSGPSLAECMAKMVEDRM